MTAWKDGARIMSAPTVVFDLDGTLVDTAPDLVAALNMVFAAEGIPQVTDAAGRNMVGSGVRRMIELAAARAGRALPQLTLERMYEAFVAHYAAHIAERSKPFPGATEALDALLDHGYRLAVCTNKLTHLAQSLLHELRLADRFIVICGPDSFGISKPDPGILQRTIAAAGGRPNRAVMVGDSPIDAQTARAAQVPLIAVNFGYTEIPAADFGAWCVIDHYDQLLNAVCELIPLGSKP